MRLFGRDIEVRRPESWTPWFVALGAVVAFGITLALIAGVQNDVNEAREERARQICQAQVDGRKALRSVIRVATEPGASGPVDLPDDPTIDDPDVIPYIEMLIEQQQTDPSRILETRRRILAKAPSLRCTPRGVPVEL